MDKEMLQNTLYSIRTVTASLSIDNTNQFNLNKIDKELLMNKLTHLESNLLLLIGD